MAPATKRVADWIRERPRRAAWGLFALACALVLGRAVAVTHATPAPVADGAITGPQRMRFGKTEAERREIFRALVAGEPADRARALAESETAVWNRNHDDFFHQFEAGRVAGVAARARIPAWQAWLIFDEGLRAHWPPPAGVEVRADDAPLARTTRPLAQRPVLIPAP